MGTGVVSPGPGVIATGDEEDFAGPTDQPVHSLTTGDTPQLRAIVDVDVMLLEAGRTRKHLMAG